MLVKDTPREKASPNEAPALTENGNMNICKHMGSWYIKSTLCGRFLN